jgi:hypothetical protein
MSKHDSIRDELLLDVGALAQRPDCAKRAACLDVAIRAGWYAWTCRGCEAYVAAPLRAVDVVLGRRAGDEAA